MNSGGNRKPANTEDEPDDITTPVSRSLRSANASLPVIAPILAGVRSPRLGRKPAHWTRIDRDYETLRTAIQTLFHDLGITTAAPAAA